MRRLIENNSFKILAFLGLFGFSIGLFDNYREMWMSLNGLTTSSISHIISISYIVTVLSLIFFTLKVSIDKLKKGIVVSLILKLFTDIILLMLNATQNYFLMKFIMFFNISFSQLIISSIYPLMMNFARDDIMYTKKDFVESLFNKLGFLLVTFILGKTIFNRIIDYNFCLFLSTIFTILSASVLVTVKIPSKKEKQLDVRDSIKYFNQNKVLYFFLFVNMLGTLIWQTILGMPMLLLTQELGFSTSHASIMILGLGIISNLLSMIVVKYLKSRNDYINLFFKFGVRLILYILTFITNNSTIMIITIIYLYLTDCTYNFIFSGFFLNKIDEKYSLLITVFKYCSSLIGKSIGIFICGLFFGSNIRLFVIPTVVLSIVHYAFASILIKKKSTAFQN